MLLLNGLTSELPSIRGSPASPLVGHQDGGSSAILTARRAAWGSEAVFLGRAALPPGRSQVRVRLAGEGHVAAPVA